MMQTVEPLGCGEKCEAKGEAMQPLGSCIQQCVACTGEVMQGKLYKHLLIQAAGCAASCCSSRPKQGGCRGGPHLLINSKTHLGRGPARVIEPQHEGLGHPRLSQRGAQQVGRVVLRCAEQQTGGGMGRQELQRALH